MACAALSNLMLLYNIYIYSTSQLLILHITLIISKNSNDCVLLVTPLMISIF